MGILTKEVDVLVSGLNKKHYIEKGYIKNDYYTIYRKDRNSYEKKFGVPKGTRIIVKLEEVPSGSAVKVDVQCDHCGVIKSLQYASVLRQIDRLGMTLCNSCATRYTQCGEKSYRWKSDLTQDDRERHRFTPLTSDWSLRVRTRDNFKCVICGSNEDLNAHHINGYEWDKEHRYDIDNGATLCENCHYSFHGRYGYKNNTREQFNEFANNAKMELKLDGIVHRTRWIYCLEDKALIKNVYQYCNDNTNVTAGMIRECAKGVRPEYKGKHYVWYNEYRNMSEHDIEELLSKHNKR